MPDRLDSQGDGPEAIFAEYLARRLGGSDVEFEELLRDHADLADALRQLRLQHEHVDGVLDVFFRRKPRSSDSGTPIVHLPDAKPGMVLGDFELVEVIGEGGMGQVWEARELSLGRTVALKLVRPDKVTARSFMHFHREAKAGGRLNHPGLVTVYSTGEEEGVPWIAQELVEGCCALSDALDDLGQEDELPRDYFRSVARFFKEIAEALEFAHSKEVIHRDITPRNIFVTEEGHPKVGDFGLARLQDEASVSETVTHAGTPPYMSPEQLDPDASPVDQRSDVFSLGAVLYEALTLERAFGDSSIDLFTQVREMEPADARTIEPGVPEELAVICAKALEKRRTDRFQSMAELAAELGRFLDYEPILTKPPGAWQRARKWTRRHPTTSVALLVGAVGLAVAIGFMVIASMERDKRRRSQFDSHLLEAQQAIFSGDMEKAIKEARSADQLVPGEPSVHLLLAFGYYQVGQGTQAEEQLERAIEDGFSADSADVRPDSAEDQLHYGLYLLADSAGPRYAESAVHLERAIEILEDQSSLEQSLPGAYYMLFQVRKAHDENAAARAALVAFLELVPSRLDQSFVAKAQLQELDGEYEAGLAVLKELRGRPGMDDARFSELRCHRLLGRLYVGAGNLSEARLSFERAVELVPEDGDSLLNLALILQRGSDSDLERALALATRAREFVQLRLPAARTAAALSFGVLREQLADPSSAEEVESAWERVRANMEILREIEPADPLLAVFAARQCLLIGMELQEERRYEEAEEQYRSAVEHDPGQVGALVCLGQACWFQGEYDASLDVLSEARAVLDAASGYEGSDWIGWSARLLAQRADVWGFGAAAELGDVDAAEEARDRIELELTADPSFDRVELLNYAEFLTTEKADIQDCDRAREIVAAFELREFFSNHVSAQASLQLIEERCPR